MAMPIQATTGKRNRLALSSVIWGVAGMLLLFNGSSPVILIVALVLGLIAGWTGLTGLRRAREMGQRGRNWSLAGIAIGVIDLLVAVVLLLSTG